MSTKIEKIADRRISSQESPSLLYCLEPPHTSLRHPGRLMRLLCPIVGILAVVMNNVWHYFSMSNAVAPQLIRHDLLGFTAMTL
ncbi:MAG: hypothetical protein ACJARU_000110 [Congregibacter sp.]|jgi:hypothetical protein